MPEHRIFSTKFSSVTLYPIQERPEVEISGREAQEGLPPKLTQASSMWIPSWSSGARSRFLTTSGCARRPEISFGGCDGIHRLRDVASPVPRESRVLCPLHQREWLNQRRSV